MRSVLITGASSGIGAATALRLDADGIRVFASTELAQDGTTALAGASERLTRIVLDVADDRSIRQAVESVRAQAPNGLDGLVNNAGVGFPGPLEIPPLNMLRRQLDVNVKESLESADEHGKSPEDVAEVIAQALPETRPDARYVVGGSGKIATALKPLVPDRLADKLAEQTAKT